MPLEVVFFQEDDGSVPVFEWLADLRKRERRVFAKCAARISRLAEMGHGLRRPEADYLRDGIYELRIRYGSVNYRVLYFFHKQWAAVLAHSLVKERAVPQKDIELAIVRRRRFERDPERHTYHGEAN